MFKSLKSIVEVLVLSTALALGVAACGDDAEEASAGGDTGGEAGGEAGGEEGGAEG